MLKSIVRNVRNVAAPVVVVTLLGAGAASAGKGAFEGPKSTAVKNIKAAIKRIDTVPQCAQNTGANIRDGLKQAQSLTAASPADQFDNVVVFLSAVGIAGALSSCPNDVPQLIVNATDAINVMKANAAGGANAGSAPAPAAAPQGVYASGDDEPAPAAPVASGTRGVTADDVQVDPNFTDNTGAAAILFHAVRPQASGLAGKKIAWSLLVKRKSQPWNKAKSFSIGETKVTAPQQQLGDVSMSIRYTTFAQKGMSPGDYVAALVGNVKSENVFRDEMPFVLPAFGAAASDDDDNNVAYSNNNNGYATTGTAGNAVYNAPAAAAAPRAMADAAFTGFLNAVRNTVMDNAKADMIKNAARKSWFTAAQLGQLMDTFVMDNNRLDASLAVAPRLVDRENAYGLADKFIMNNNRAAFTAALSQ